MLIGIIGALINWLIRGGGIKQWFPGFRFGKAINVLLFGVCAYYVSGNPVFAVCMALAMLIGQAPAIFSGDLTFMKGLLRGAVWVVPIILPMFYLYKILALLYIPAMLGMGLCYLLPIKSENKVITSWAQSEIGYGFLLWFPLGFIV